MSLATEIIPIIEKVGIPLISIAGGWIGGMLRTQGRLADVENKLAKLDKELSEASITSKRTAEVVVEIQKSLETMASRYVDRETYNEQRSAEAVQWQTVSKALGRLQGYLEGQESRNRQKSLHDTD
jgi:hypothetical protein